MSFKEAASELGISEEELEKLVASNEIASTKDGDSLLFTKEAIDNYKNQGEAEIILSDDDLDILGDDDDEIDFGIDLTGNFLLAANQETHTIVSFRVGKASGRPAPAGVITSVSMPVCLVFLHLPE